MTLITILKKIIAYIFPPYEAWIAKKYIEDEKNVKSNQENAEKISDTFFKKISSKTCSGSYLSQVDILEESEIHRKEILESKASTLLGILGVVIAIISFVITNIEENWKITFSLSEIISNDILLYPNLIIWSFILAIFHLVLSIWYSLKVISVAEFYITTPDLIKNCISNYPKNFYEKLSSEKLKNIQLNQPKLRIKSNWLYVSQTLFRRGIIFLGIGTIILLFYRLLV